MIIIIRIVYKVTVCYSFNTNPKEANYQRKVSKMEY
jgi:hypothetical protein